ncbi:MAG: CHAT domain-containing protein, partial [Acidobacteriota bacterium]
VDENNRYLVTRYSFTYLTSGRDLLRLKEKIKSKQTATVIANPNYGAFETAAVDRGLLIGKGSNKATQTASGGRMDISRIYFGPLPATQEEAQTLKRLFPHSVVLTKGEATETALKQVNSPVILHIATHGFFLEDVQVKPAADSGRGLLISNLQPDQFPRPLGRIENPLLRSGLGFAGANLKSKRDDDGILTAAEASGLNLWGTKLVVLSACDTGVGEVKNSEGVYGLRRALVLAGSETQVMSLWPVSDTGTRDLMIGYYKGLKAGLGRSAALRDVQLRMLASRNWSHPYFWASFIQSGEWANLNGRR